MSGTLDGGLKAAKTNYQKHGSDFYRRIGAMGGRNGHTGGFASEKVGKDGLTGRQRASLVGKDGGHNGKRGPARRKDEDEDDI